MKQKKSKENLKHSKKLLLIAILLIFSLSFFASAGNETCSCKEITPCDGLFYSCNDDGCKTVCDWGGIEGACDSGCGASSQCDDIKPGGKGDCQFGYTCNSDCSCELVDYDLDTYETEEDCDDENPNIHPMASERCNQKDDDCDGDIDEGSVCTVNVYVCKTRNFDDSTEECSGGEWVSGSTTYDMLSIVYSIVSDDLRINNFYTYVCDGYLTDGDYGCFYFTSGEFSVVGSTGNYTECMSGETQTCGTNEGICREGVQECADGIWGACGGSGYVGAEDEVCGDGLDNDCDGLIDEDCDCAEGETQGCGSNVGVCKKGTQTCTNNTWGGCEGEVTPFTEICDDGLDNDCDGLIDEDDPNCQVDDDNGGDGDGSYVTETIPNCGGGMITSKCKCGDKIYTRGYCYSDVYGRSSDDSGGDGDGDGDTTVTITEEDEKEEKSSFWLWFLIILVIILLVVFLFVMYKKGKIKLGFLKKAQKKILFLGKIQFGKTSKKSNLNELIDFFDKSMKKGKNRNLLITKAFKKGWKKVEVDAALKEVDLRHKKFNPLIGYLKRTFGGGSGKNKIKKEVLKSGWDKKDFRFAVRNAKKK